MGALAAGHEAFQHARRNDGYRQWHTLYLQRKKRFPARWRRAVPHRQESTPPRRALDAAAIFLDAGANICASAQDGRWPNTEAEARMGPLPILMQLPDGRCRRVSLVTTTTRQ